jgi:hypothetical protein
VSACRAGVKPGKLNTAIVIPKSGLDPSPLHCTKEIKIKRLRHHEGMGQQTVLEVLAAGDSVEDILEEYPKLTRTDMQACLDYASRLMGNHFSVVRAA